MNGKRKSTGVIVDEKYDTVPLDLIQYEKERDGDEDPHVVEEKQWLAKEVSSCYQIVSEPITQDYTKATRFIVMDWMREVANEWKHHAQTWYMACNYVDRYILSKQITRNNFQLLGLTCLWIAAKMEEANAEEIEEVIYIADHLYTARQICVMECSILEVLHANLRPPTVYAWLEHYKIDIGKDDENKAKHHFVLHCLQLDIECARFAPSQLAKLLLKHDKEHPLASKIDRFYSLYEKYRPSYNQELCLIDYYDDKKWQEWMELN